MEHSAETEKIDDTLKNLKGKYLSNSGHIRVRNWLGK